MRQRVGQLLADAASGCATRAMLRTGHEVVPRSIGQRNGVAATIVRDQAGVGLPVLVFGIDLHHQWIAGWPLQDAIRSIRDRVGGDRVTEGKDDAWEDTCATPG